MSSENICSSSEGTKYETQSTTKIGRILVWVPVILFCKISFLVKHLMAYYAETSRSRP
jgi:hypothetical protein